MKSDKKSVPARQTKETHAGYKRKRNQSRQTPGQSAGSLAVVNAETRSLADGQEAAKAAGSTAIIKALDNERLEPETNSKTKEPEVVWTHEDFARELKRAQRAGPSKMSYTDLLMFLHRASGYYRVRFCFELKPFFVELWRRIDKGELTMSKTEACRRIGCTPQWANAIVSGRADERREQRGEAKEAKTRNLVSATKLESSGGGRSDYQDDRARERCGSEEVKEPGELGSAGNLTLCDVDWSDDEDDRREIREEAKTTKLVSSGDEDAALLTRDEYVRQVLKAAFAKLKPVIQRDWQLYRDVCEELSKQFGEASKTPPVAKALTAGAS